MALFFYAGHGVQVNGLNYMMPIDAKLAEESDVYSETVELNDVLEAHGTAVEDQHHHSRCLPQQSSPAESGARDGNALGRGLSGIGRNQVRRRDADRVRHAARKRGAGWREKNSPFTAGLLKHLETPNIDIAIMLRRVRDEVIDSTKGQQVPWEHSSLRGAPIMLKAGPLD